MWIHGAVCGWGMSSLLEYFMDDHISQTTTDWALFDNNIFHLYTVGFAYQQIPFQ